MVVRSSIARQKPKCMEWGRERFVIFKIMAGKYSNTECHNAWKTRPTEGFIIVSSGHGGTVVS